MLIPLAIGAAGLAFLFYTNKPKGVTLLAGQSAMITKQISPVTMQEWQEAVANPGSYATLAAALFPLDGDYTVDSITPAPATGVFSMVITARRAVTYKPRTVKIDKYTVTDIAARKV